MQVSKMAREKSQTSKESSFAWSDDEVKLLLDITREHRNQKMLSGNEWESVTSKYADIANRFIEVAEEYRTSSEGSSKEYRRNGEEITREKVATKLKAAGKKYRSTVDTGRKRGHGRVALLCFEKCQKIWRGSPATVKLSNGFETIDISEDSLTTTIASPKDNCSATEVTKMNESSTQLTSNGSASDGSDIESSSMPVMNSRETLLKRTALLD